MITDYSKFSSAMVVFFLFRIVVFLVRFLTQPAEVYQDKKGAHIFFFGNFPGQKRSFFFFLIHFSSCVSVLNVFFFLVCVCDATRKITSSLLYFLSSFVKRFFFCFCAEIRMQCFDHKGSCWCRYALCELVFV